RGVPGGAGRVPIGPARRSGRRLVGCDQRAGAGGERYFRVDGLGGPEAAAARAYQLTTISDIFFAVIASGAKRSRGSSSFVRRSPSPIEGEGRKRPSRGTVNIDRCQV